MFLALYLFSSIERLQYTVYDFFFSREPADFCGSPGQCGWDYQGAEEWRSSPGLQSQRWHDCPAQSCTVQEPGHTHGKGAWLLSSCFTCALLELLQCKPHDFQIMLGNVSLRCWCRQTCQLTEQWEDKEILTVAVKWRLTMKGDETLVVGPSWVSFKTLHSVL